MEIRSRLRWLRDSKGWTQDDLARRVGISRAEISGIETGRLRPSVVVALSLARVFACPVEEIFSLAEAASPTARWATPPGPGGRFWRAEIDERDTFYGVEPTAAGAIAHDGIVRDGQPELRTGIDPSQTLVVAGCDPAVGLLAAELLRVHGIRLIPLNRSSRSALELLRKRAVHAAGVHLSDQIGRSGNRRVVHGILGPGYRLLRLASWQVGLAYRSDLSPESLTELHDRALRWTDREEDAGARTCKERLLNVADSASAGALKTLDHRGVAQAIRNGWAEAGVCVQLAAEEAGLSFLPVQEEAYDICYPPQFEGDPRLDALLDVVRSQDLRGVVSELPGYDVSMTGEVRTA